MATPTEPCSLAVIGRGRLGTAMTHGLRAAGRPVEGPLGREPDLRQVDAVLLCVPDHQIADSARRLAGLGLRAGALVGHCSGATSLQVLGDHEGFLLHPLMTVPDAPSGTPARSPFPGSGCGVAGSTARGLRFARDLAEDLGMSPLEVADADRLAYHAAAAMASNFLVTLEGAAERLAETAGLTRTHLVPLVRATVKNWERLGPQAALTGPIARGDTATVRAHRRTVAERAPELLDLWEALARATRELARAPADPGPGGRATRPPVPDPPLVARRSVSELRSALGAARGAKRRIGLVATMGALHDGHLSLIRAAAADCDEVVVSVFVNPTQFGTGEDLGTYPRDERRDAELAARAGATLLFAPATDEIYPDGFATSVSVDGLSEGLCGASRGPGHFAGVATVVAKLLNIVGPDAAYFGQKDAQQAAVIRRLVADLNFAVEIVVCPTVREPDGLAMSSRNAYLRPLERQRAVALPRALVAAQRAVSAGEHDRAVIIGQARAAMIELGVEPEYLELVDPETLAPADSARCPVLIAVAARVGSARLIDNALLVPAPGEAFYPDHPPGQRRTDIGAQQPCNA